MPLDRGRFVNITVIKTILYVASLTVNGFLVPSSRHHVSCDDSLEDTEDKRKDYRSCSVLYCVLLHIYELLLQITVGLGLLFIY